MHEKDLLRAVYVAELLGGVATVEAVANILDDAPREVQNRLEAATREGLVDVEEGAVSLTPKGKGKLTVVMIGGAFEIIHPGHVHTTSEAKKLGDVLVVVVAADSTVMKNKKREPVTSQEWRVRLVSALRDVDAAVPGGLGSIYDMLEKIRPDIVALGYDQWHIPQDIENEAVRRGMKVRVVRLSSPLPDVKTSKIVGTL
jgi:cytidyltransferase-like protein